MQYIIFVEEDDDSVMHAAPVPAEDAAYLARVAENLKPLADEDYMNGPAVILHTFARYSYILHNGDVLWCAEWTPGLIVVRFSPSGELAWAAIRSPNPEFGGREPLPEDLEGYDEDAENPQYNLVFDPWDAQFDKQDREWRSFAPASAETQSQFEAALDAANKLGATMEQRYSAEQETWAKRGQENLEAWAGDGLRLC